MQIVDSRQKGRQERSIGQKGRQIKSLNVLTERVKYFERTLHMFGFQQKRGQNVKYSFRRIKESLWAEIQVITITSPHDLYLYQIFDYKKSIIIIFISLLLLLLLLLLFVIHLSDEYWINQPLKARASENRRQSV